MKKIYRHLLILLFLGTISSTTFARMHNIMVSSFQFAPSTLNVFVSDTIMWIWMDGSHTTTSDAVPTGAADWNTPLNSSSPVFMYVVTEPGQYSYHCIPHASMGMTGSFTAALNTGIESPSLKSVFSIARINSEVFNISFELSRTAPTQLSLVDLTGRIVKNMEASVFTAGTYSRVYDFSDLRKGIYLLNLVSGSERATKRIVID